MCSVVSVLVFTHSHFPIDITIAMCFDDVIIPVNECGGEGLDV